MENDQNLTLSEKDSNGLALSESSTFQCRLDEMIVSCLALQKLYGKDVANTEMTITLFHQILGQYPGHKVIKAFETWLQRNQEFPTPADIIGLIKRNGRPPIKESDVISIRKKDGCDRTSDDWELLRAWDAEQRASWGFEEQAKQERTEQENTRLRQEVKTLRAENERLTDLLHQAKLSKGLERPKPSVQEQIDNTVKAMKEMGAPQDDIDIFLIEMRATSEFAHV